MTGDIHEMREQAIDAKDFLEHRAWMRAIRDLNLFLEEDLMLAKTAEENMAVVALKKALKMIPDRMKKQIENYNFELRQPRRTPLTPPEDKDAS